MTISAEKLATARAENGWSDARIEVLRSLWEDGRSCTEIAKQLTNVSRNGVIGKVTRLGLQRRSAMARTIAGGINSRALLKAPPVARKPNENAGLAFGSKAVSAPKVLPPPQRKAQVASRDPKIIAHPGFGGCRWPIDGDGADTLFCCEEQAPGRRYCEAHAAIAYEPFKASHPKSGDELARSLRKLIA